MNVNLKIAIVRSGKRQIEIARRLGKHHTWLSRVVQGWVAPSPQDRRSLARLLGVTEDQIFPGS